MADGEDHGVDLVVAQGCLDCSADFSSEASLKSSLVQPVAPITTSMVPR
jgi:hypothetical protein